ncbi:uncharacterized protein LOC120767312 [Bactrocera tryoni]|uniref:uncharacterized protein LOC120767312 n=1 Tax=Bactrocera tryoni TaxID=59916 RepID=UPI001A95EC7C|nr:uncharacterized protein LOC120767312 [Bactrocera tryoni]
MTPIAQALDFFFFQGEQNVKFGLLLAVLITLSNKLQKLRKKEFHLSSVAAKINLALWSRFEIFFSLSPEANIAITAAVLTPEVKMKWQPVLERSTTGINKEIVSRRVIQEICRFAESSNLAIQNNLKSNDLKHSSSFFDFDDDDDDRAKETNNMETDQIDVERVVSDQFYAYVSDVSDGPDVWERCPLLKQASIFFNIPLTSSAPVEKLFSFAGIVNTPRRGCLKGNFFEKLVLLKANVKFNK